MLGTMLALFGLGREPTKLVSDSLKPFAPVSGRFGKLRTPNRSSKRTWDFVNSYWEYKDGRGQRSNERAHFKCRQTGKVELKNYRIKP